MKKFLMFFFCFLFFNLFFAGSCDPNEGPPDPPPPPPPKKVEIIVQANITYQGMCSLHQIGIWLQAQDDPPFSYGGSLNVASGSTPPSMSKKFVFEGEEADKLIGRKSIAVVVIIFRSGDWFSPILRFYSPSFTIKEGVNPTIVVEVVQPN